MNSKVRSFTVKSKLYRGAMPGFGGASVSAQTPSPANKIAVILFKAIVGTKDGQKAAAELDSKAAPKKMELEQKQNEINSLQDQFSKGQNTLSEAAKNELYKNIELKKKASSAILRTPRKTSSRSSRGCCSSWRRR